MRYICGYEINVLRWKSSWDRMMHRCSLFYYKSSLLCLQGVLPIDVLDATDGEKAQALLTNAEQILAQFQVHRLNSVPLH